MFKGIVFFIKNGWKYDKLYIIWMVLFQFTNSLIPIVAVILPKYMIDELMGTKNVYRLILYVAILAGYILIATCLSNYWNWDAFSRRCKVSAEFDSDLHRRLAEADFERLEDPHFLDLQEKAQKFLYCDWHGFGYLLDCAMMIIGQCFTLIGISVVIITLDWRIVAVFVVSLIISTILEGKQKKKAMRLSQEIARDQRGWKYFSELFEDFNCGKEIRMNSMGKWLLARERNYFTKVNVNLKQQNDTYIKAGNWGAFFTFLQQIFSYGYLLVCVVEDTISIGSFTMYTTAVTAFASSFRRVMESIIEIRAYDMYYDDLDEYLNVPKKLRQGKDSPKITGKDQIEFKNVSFRYPGNDQYVLKNINICIRSGEKLSVVGENGAGKTTFVKLLTRLYDPTEGEILLNGINIKKIEYEQYMSFFSTVYQDYKLFSFSVRDNIALALPFEEKKMQEVIERVGLSKKLRNLPKGIDTMLYKNFSEDGFDPSGGEGQKIALARALYKDAPFVVLDEPTAAWDPRAEYEMYRQFNEIVKGKTAVYISHRMSSTKFCDKVAVLEKGKLVEYGTHEELMNGNGLYRELFDMQAQYYNDK